MRPKRVAVPSLLAGVLVLVLAGCGGGGDSETNGTAQGSGGATTTEPAAPPKPGGAAPRAETVEMVDFAFDRPAVTIQAGGKVIWKNQGQAPHTATADDKSFDTGTVEPGKLKSETFKAPGTVAYHCEFHPQMHGTIEVVPD